MKQPSNCILYTKLNYAQNNNNNTNKRMRKKNILWFNPGTHLTQSAWEVAADYTDCTSAEEELSPSECPRYVTKQSDDEAPVMLELWGMQSTILLPSLPGPLWPGVVAPDRDLWVKKN